MSQQKVDAGAKSQIQQISVDEVARAVTQGVLRALETHQRELQNQSALIGKDLTVAGGRFEFIVRF
jgi:hypothetical protein